MGSAELTFVAFGSLSMVATAFGLLMKDLIFGSDALRASKRSLRRRRNGYERAIDASIAGKLNHGFDRLVLETGLEISPWTGFLMVVASGLILGGGTWVATDNELFSCGAGMIGMVVPIGVFVFKRRQRMIEIRQQLPSVIDMVARSTRSGRSVEQALTLVAEETDGILSKEIERVVQQLGVGAALDRTLKRMAVRLPVIEARIFTTTLIVQRRSGGHLSSTLERLATVIRERTAAQNQVRVTTSAGRMSSMIIAAMAPIALCAVMVLNPAHVQVFFEDPLGKTLLAAAIALEIVGILWIVMLIREDG
ncbi:type II secretion system F family protein [Thalassoglobus sp. JC818]|uniref:type II secretion system F family protein n=1 Tax=Thalassoglobus sp. JC818 TaxID=3232136 RepID=UPI00345A77F6